MKMKIVSDSSADIREMQGVEYASVPLHIIVGEKDFIDDESVDLTEMEKELREYRGKTSTACMALCSYYAEPESLLLGFES